MEFRENWARRKTEHQEAPVDPSVERQEKPKGDFDSISSSEEFIAAVDFDELNSIFDKMSGKSAGGEATRTTKHRVLPENITFFHRNPSDTTTPDGRAIVFSGKIEMIVPGTEVYQELPRGLSMLSTLVHESTHIRGGYDFKKHDFTYEDGSRGYKAAQRVGVAERFDSDTQAEPEKVGTDLNEAITEEISHEVLIEYLTRTGNTAYLADPAIRNALSDKTYRYARHLLDAAIRMLSKELDVDRDHIWRGFVQAYMSGNQTLIELLKNISSQMETSGAYKLLVRSALDAEEDVSYDELLRNIPTPQEQLEFLDHTSLSIDTRLARDVLGIR